MSLRYYFDVHVPLAIATELHKRSVDVLCAQDDGADELDDVLLLDRAKELDRVDGKALGTPRITKPTCLFAYL